MKPEEQRIAIAEEVNEMGLSVCPGCWNYIDPDCCGCGDSKNSHTGYDGHSFIPMGCRCGYADQPQPSSVPDYLNDLNAMHEAEKVLGKHTGRYTKELARITQGEWQSGYTSNFLLLHATAAQRAEAFLRTLNLWKE